jgi:NAD(P)-dependent dehydrogenase (short-subunit alcohol dehydrogenase family)
MRLLRDLTNITFLELDVTSTKSIASAYRTVENQTGGKLHYLVNNSGAGFVMPLLDSDIEMGQHLFDVNVWGVVRVTQTFAPLLVRAKGTIVNNISIASCLGLPYQGMLSFPNKGKKFHSKFLQACTVDPKLRRGS